MAATATGQSFNIDFGPVGVAPVDSYAAAGQPGHWVSLPGAQGVNYTNLVDVDGNVTAARFTQFGGTQTLTTPDPALSGADARLMNDYLITFTAIENCLFFHDLEPGTYEVIIYARMPVQPTVMSYTNIDQEIGNPHYEVGGVWAGQHEEFVSYSLHYAEVTNGDLFPHSGVAPGGNLADGAALNGIQLRKLEPIPGDIDGDFDVDTADLLALLAAWGPCRGCPEDIDGDGSVGTSDLPLLLSNWG